MSINFLKVAQAADLQGRDRFLYRVLEILPAFLSLGTLLALIIFSYLKPVGVAYFIIVFDVYWLILVFFLSLHLIAAYRELKKNIKIDWREKCQNLPGWQDLTQLVILPVYQESEEIIKACLDSIINEEYPLDKFIIVLTAEERAGEEQLEKCRRIVSEYKTKFKNFLFTAHPDGITGELKGKGANQGWAARLVKQEIIDPQKFDYDKIIVSVFDIDTVIRQGYFYRLVYAWLTVPNPLRTSYQPIPVYNNNLWESPFFSRVSSMSNTFWQMMQQVRQEKLATYSSHSMSFRALTEIDFWAPNMVSEDSRIFWHCFCHYNGDYRVEPLYFPVSMDVCMDKSNWRTIKNLYKQQRRWGWGVENMPYLVFNVIKRWQTMPKKEALSRIFVQIYGFHAWATNALIIAIIGWLPLIIGGTDFNATALSGNLPLVTRTLMTLAMFGLVLSAIISTLLLPKRPTKYGFGKIIEIIIQWIFLPVIIIVFGSFPALESQTRLALGGKWRLGFWVTPKQR
ncbi:MAG: glycosyltransferase family 2 protein [Patescibacteria group bacterium]